jgi:UDPglucose 6-dehydrogenase
MKVGIIGVGVVGGATAQAFETCGFDVRRYDIISYNTVEHWQGVLDTDMVFVCVPTLTINGIQDKTPIEDVSRRLSESVYKGVVCVKCTVLPGTCEDLRSRHGLRVVHNPEFLTAAKPFEDFMSQAAIIMSGSEDSTSVVEAAYKALLPGVPTLKSQRFEVTEIAKYMRNCYLAIKVTYANEISELCNSVGVCYDDVKGMMLSQGKIETGHWNVPGPDGKTGYGLGCLPKDTRALSSYLKERGLHGDILDASITGNTFRRKFDDRCREVEVDNGREILREIII